MPAGVNVSVTPTSIAVAAGETEQASVKLHNSGQGMDQFTVSIDGLDSRWYALPVSSVALFPNDEDTLKIVLQPPKDGAKGGSYPFRLKVASQEDPANSTTVDLTLLVETIPEVALQVEQVSGGRKSHFRVIASNPAPADAALQLTTATADSRLTLSLDPRSLKVPAAGRAEAQVDASLGWMSLFFGKKEAEFRVVGNVPGGQEVSATAKAEVVRWQKVLSQIRLPWLTRPPAIVSFKSTTDDKREFKLTWSVKRAGEVRLDEDLLKAAGEKTVRPTEARTYVLTATNRYGTVSRTVELQPITLPQASSSERIRVVMPQSALKVSAGGTPVPLALQVQNLGQIVDKFSIDVAGVDEVWFSRSASSVALMPQATGQAQVLFQPPRQKPVRAGTYPFAVVVRSQSAPEEATTVLGQLEILPMTDFNAAIHPYRVTTHGKGGFRVALANTGVSEMSVDLEATDLDEGLKFNFKDQSYVLPAWSSIEVPMVVKPKRGSMVGEKKQYDITLTARGSDGKSHSATCVMQHQPRMASWRPITRTIRILIAIGIVVVVVYFVLKWGGGWGVLTSSPQTFVDNFVATIEGWFRR